METVDVALIGHAPTSGDSRARAAALVRDVILGGQDGLVNVLGLVLGMAVATGDTRLVVTAGLAALLAESIAMAGVAFTASGAERQLARTTGAALDRAHRERSRARAAALRRRLIADGRPTEVVALVSREVDEESRAWAAELEVTRQALAPARETRPIRAAVVVGLSTAVGSAVPIVPFLVLPIAVAPIVALAAGATVLAVAGIQRAVLTGGDIRRAATEMVAIGLVSAFAGYLVGQVLQAPAG
ncbi:MAG TPA: VIT1/CCC1 transporter family protein [Candidatus Limnocylindrales bacterium]|nr:VIT1/CCC1 transporter family protein [Candidatus Limnocylindrales bacterium]